MKQVFVVVDLGGNSRVAVIDLDGKLLAIRQKQSEYFMDPDFPFGGMSFDAEQWKADIFQATREVLAEAGDVEVIAVSSSSQREGGVLIGKNGESLVGFPNSDMRGMEYMMQTNWARVAELTFLTPLPMYTASKFRATAQKQPEVAAKTRYITSISDWAGFLFTNEVVWERSQAMHSAVYELAADRWSDELCQIIGIEASILPPLCQAGTILGHITAEASAATGIPESAVFVVGGADTQLAMEGVQALAGDIIIVNGTTTPIVAVSDSIVSSPCWISPHVLAGKYMLEVNAGSTGSNLDALMQQLQPAKPLAQIEAEGAAKGLPGCTAVFSTNMFIPGDMMMTGAFLVDNPLRAYVSPDDYVHALILNIGFQIKAGMDLLLEHVPSASGQIIGTGGGFSGSVCAQAVANTTGKDIYIYENFRQATISGCINLCCKALDLPLPARVLKEVVTPASSPQFDSYYADWLAAKSALGVIQKQLF